MNLKQNVKLQKLKSKYAYDLAFWKPMPAQPKHDSSEGEDLLKTLLLLDIDRTITSVINDTHDVVGDDETVALITVVLAKSYGQLHRLYVKKHGDASKLESIFNKSFEESKKEAENDRE